MADNNTLNFDLDAPAVPTLTLDPTPEAAEEKKPEPAPAAQQPEVQLTPEEQAMVDSFAEKIDITNSQQVLQYGSACQKKIGDFSEAALAKVSTKDLGEVGDMITNLIGELKSFDANEEQQKGILGFFKKKGNELDNLKTKYNKAETNVENIQSMLEGHQVQLLKDIAMLDKMYELNMAYFKELSMYILAGKKKLAEVRANELQQAMDKATQAERAVTDMTNDLLKKNADALKMGTIETAKESQRGVVDIETLQQTNKSLIETLDELNKIQTEGRAKRVAAEQELTRIEDELKQKMMEIRS